MAYESKAYYIDKAKREAMTFCQQMIGFFQQQLEERCEKNSSSHLLVEMLGNKVSIFSRQQRKKQRERKYYWLFYKKSKYKESPKEEVRVFGKNASLFILECQGTQVTPHITATYPLPSGYMTVLQLPFT